VLCC